VRSIDDAAVPGQAFSPVVPIERNLNLRRGLRAAIALGGQIPAQQGLCAADSDGIAPVITPQFSRLHFACPPIVVKSI